MEIQVQIAARKRLADEYKYVGTLMDPKLAFETEVFLKNCE